MGTVVRNVRDPGNMVAMLGLAILLHIPGVLGVCVHTQSCSCTQEKLEIVLASLELVLLSRLASNYNPPTSAS
jgi:hypothetical protein